MPKLDSGIKNCYQFLFKILIKQFHDETWNSTHEQMKKESPIGTKPKNIYWKQVFKRISEEGLRQGPESANWQTLVKVLEIVRNPEPFLTNSEGKQVIKFKNEQSGKLVFVDRCQNELAANILGLMKSAIAKSVLPEERKRLFNETLVDINNNTWETNFLFENEEEPHNIGYNQGQNDKEDNHETPYKKLKTGTNDFTLKSSTPEEEVFMEFEESFQQNNDFQQIKNVVINEEVKSNVIFNEKNEADYNRSNNNGYVNKETPISIHGDDRDKIIEDLRRKLFEKDLIIGDRDKKIELLEQKMKNIYNFEGNLPEINNEEVIVKNFLNLDLDSEDI